MYIAAAFNPFLPKASIAVNRRVGNYYDNTFKKF